MPGAKAPWRWLLDYPATCLGLVTLALHLWVNGSYGYFRDELYFIASAGWALSPAPASDSCSASCRKFTHMFGWPELAEIVGKAYQALPPEDRRRAVFFGRGNCGEAAAVDFFGGPGACRLRSAQPKTISSGARAATMAA
jgi:hypothetical protein